MRFHQVGLVTALLLGTSTASRGDVVAVAGQPAVVGARVLGLENGQLSYRLPDGREVSRAIREVEYLQVVGWQLFNKAEKELRDRRFRDAVVTYERVLVDIRDGRGIPATKLDRELLVRCRLLRAWDAERQFGRAVEMYLQILESSAGGAAWAAPLRPAHVPSAASSELEKAALLVAGAIEKHKGDAIGASLAAWRESWPTAPPVSNGQPAIAAVSAPTCSGIQEVRSQLRAGRYAAALKELDRLRPTLDPRCQPEWFYCRGQALLATMTSPSDAAACGRAGLTFMRVVIHFPEHALAPECLYLAGELCRRSGEGEQAATLWSELLRIYPNTVPWAEQAKRELYGHAGTATAPARSTVNGSP